jgi:hypothetical protein
MTDKLNGASAFFNNAVENGIDTIFATPGTSEMQNTTAEAWDVMIQGTEKAWKAWTNAFAEAQSKFTSKD